MHRTIVLLITILAGLSNGQAGEPQSTPKKSVSQQLLEKAALAQDQVDASGVASVSRTTVGDMPMPKEESTDTNVPPPIVAAGKPKVKTQEGATLRSSSTLAKSTSADQDSPMVKLVEGSGTSKTMRVAAPSDSSAAGTQRPAGASTGAERPSGTPISSTGLPGLGSPPGMNQGGANKAIPLQVQNGVNEIVAVSNSLPNRIQTPFADPQVIDFTETDYKVVGGDVYVVPKGTHAVGIFIRDNHPDSPAIALTLVPKAIPGVTIIANIDGGYRTGKSKGKEADDAETNGYEDALKKLMVKMAMERAPSGYTESPIDVGTAMIGPIRVVPERQFSGSTFDIYRYRLINTSKESFELSEESFYQAGVKAVAFFPLVRLDPWQSTKVFIVTGKGEASNEH